jgi:hypothetical protein
MDEHTNNQTSPDPGTTSLPPAEGRADIGEEQGTTRQPSEGQVEESSMNVSQNAKPPSEGREDVAEDLAQEQRQAYSASAGQAAEQRQQQSANDLAGQVPDPPSTGDAGTASQPNRPSSAKAED